MNSAISWGDLRPLDGSQHKAFEELCAQLASSEPISGALFVRKGAPDAGIECYWQRGNGDILGWQAKFFLHAPKAAQWLQLDESVKTALAKHPKLVHFTVCLPIDRADPKQSDSEWFMDVWEVHVKKWKRWAAAHSMSVDFTYWGQSELLNRLSHENNAGRYYFWFHKQLFSSQWFRERLEVSARNAGQRYIPTLNVDLPIRGCFDGLGRTRTYFDEFDRLRGEIRRMWAHASSSVQRVDPQLNTAEIQALIGPLLTQLGALDRHGTGALPLESLKLQVSGCIERVSSLESSLRKVDSVKGSASETFSSARHYLYELDVALDQLIAYVESTASLLVNTPALLLMGEAGVGKTHLLCSLAEARVQENQPTIVLLGEQFSREEPWAQIVKLLGLDCSAEEFLGSLDAAGQVRGGRTLIFIDALNEGEGVYLWPKFLAGMLVQIRKYRWVGIAITVRQSFKDVVVPKLDGGQVVPTYHHGFAGLESLAVTRFFAHYGIASPGVPLMQPEFSNPLFLRLFCEGIHKRGLRRVPDGLDGITAVFGFFLDSINKKLSGPGYLDFDEKEARVATAVQKVAQKMADLGEAWIPREEAKVLLCPESIPFAKSLFLHLLSEGVLSEDLFRTDGGTIAGVRFTYQRFADHQIAQFYLDRYLDPSSPESSFAPEERLGQLIQDESASWRNSGIVSAFAIQLPERVGRELPDLAPFCATFHPVREGMLESVLWRKHEAFSDATLQYLNTQLLDHPHTERSTMRAFVAIASQPGHPYNADFLHRHLIRRAMPERDAFWSTFIHDEYWEPESPVRRLLEWAAIDGVKQSITDESLLLMGTAIAWFLTSSNRFLRDSATKALVALFDKRLDVYIQVLNRFRAVDDLYVLERLCAAAYGCSLRTSDREQLTAIGAWFYGAFFARTEPPVHILIRDYARGTINRALHVGVEIQIDRDRVDPPYRASWPEDIPSEAELQHFGDWKAGVGSSQCAIYYSVMRAGDFSRYVIGTNSHSFDWISLRLGETRPPSAAEIRARFVESLLPDQKDAWRELKNAEDEASWRRIRFVGGDETEESAELEIAPRNERVDRALEVFTKSLDHDQLECFVNRIVPDQERGPDSEFRFDLGLIERFVLSRVFDLGWTSERFDDFDRHAEGRARHSRDDHKAERIGKKYQWLAYHEVLARVADNFVFQDGWPKKDILYEGTWQVSGLRDIDPSITVRSSAKSRDVDGSSWWVPLVYSDWRHEPDDIAWLKKTTDLPAIQKALFVRDFRDKSRWVTLEGSYHFSEPTPPDKEWGEMAHREIWYQLRSYVVREQDFNDMFEWAQRQNYMNRWMPESHDVYYVFLGELFWAPAYQSAASSYARENAWVAVEPNDTRKRPCPVIVTGQNFYSEGGGYDCSLDESISVRAPSPWLAEVLGLRWNGVIGEFTNRSGKVVARDPSVTLPGPSALVVSPGVVKGLKRAGYRIVWTILGEKRIIGGSFSPFPRWTELSGAVAIGEGGLRGNMCARSRRVPRR